MGVHLEMALERTWRRTWELARDNMVLTHDPIRGR